MIPERTIRAFMHLTSTALFNNPTQTVADLVIRWREVSIKQPEKKETIEHILNFGSYLIEKYKIGHKPLLLVDWGDIMDREGFDG